MYSDRLKLYEKIEKKQGSKILVYVTGDRRQGMETQIAADILDFLPMHLDKIGNQKKISLFLYSKGGQINAGWGIVNLLRQFCESLEVIIPAKAHSTATLIALGADTIIMTKQATLGPIDPTTNHALNPKVPGQKEGVSLPVSVEDVAGYFNLAKTELKIKSESELNTIFLKLSEQVHPVALGNIYRARTQIQMLASKVLSFHMDDKEKIGKIISFLCSESGSHDYTINRREAKNDLGLPIKKPDDELYALINEIYIDIRKELELDDIFIPRIFLGGGNSKQYDCTRALIESVNTGSLKFITRGNIRKMTVGGEEKVSVQPNFENWELEVAKTDKP